MADRAKRWCRDADTDFVQIAAQAEAAAKAKKLAGREAAAAAKEAELERAAHDADQQRQASRADKDAAAKAQKAATAAQQQLDAREAALQASPGFWKVQGIGGRVLCSVPVVW